MRQKKNLIGLCFMQQGSAVPGMVLGQGRNDDQPCGGCGLLGKEITERSVRRAVKRHILRAHNGFRKVRLSKVCAGVLGDGRAVLIELKKVRT